MATTNLSAYDKDKLPQLPDLKVGLVVSEWNEQITNGLKDGAIATLLDNSVKEENIHQISVPGSFELIFGCKKMLEQKKYDAVIAIGCVIQGQTRHFDFVCDGVTQGIKDLNIKYDVPTIFCVLTDQNIQQSIDRSGGKFGNKGTEAAVTAIKMAALNY